MAESADRSSSSNEWPKTEFEAAALRPAIADLLQRIPTVWEEFDIDSLSSMQSRALFLLTAAGMVERRGWLRTTIANHSTCFEVRFQATGEYGFVEAMERATAIEFETWADAWRRWREGETQDQSPFHCQEIKPQEWRLTDQGELARDELATDPETVFGFVLKRGLFGPDFWNRRAEGGRPLTVDEQRTIEKLLNRGAQQAEIPRPPVRGEGQLLEIRKLEQPAGSQPVNLTNWGEGATAFAEAIEQMVRPMFESLNLGPKAGPAQPETGKDDPSRPTAEPVAATPTPFSGGVMEFYSDRVTLCGVDICSGPRSVSRRIVLELLSRRRNDSFVPHSGDDLEAEAKLHGAKGSPGGWIRDLRSGIEDALRSASIVASGEDLVLSGGPGYRFPDSISVQFHDPPVITEIKDITDTPESTDVPNVPDDDVPNDPNVPDDDAEKRQTWILQQLNDGVHLKAPMVVKQFGCSVKTAGRDLTALKDEGTIEFIGAARTGYYRLRQKPKGP